MTDQIDPREIQALQAYLQEYGQQAEILTGQLQMLEDGRMETLAAIEALKSLAAQGEQPVLLQIGGGAMVRAKIEAPDQVLVNIGADVTVERTNSDAIEFLKDRITEMEASVKKLVENIDRIRSQMNEISRRIETAYRQYQAAGGGPPPARTQ